MKHLLKSTVISTGFAMFSMFFGAGNIVFPLAIGQISKDQTVFAVIGLLISAVLVPFTGLISMILFYGDYRAFFERLGKWPGFLISLIIMGLIGPFGAIPRCITLSYSTINMFLRENAISLPVFSIISCIIILLFTIKPSKILDILGYILTPFLLISLFIIISVGLYFAPPIPESGLSSLSTFLLGFKEGYQTMDLIGAFFFSSVIIVGLCSDFFPKSSQDKKILTLLAVKSSLVGGILLSLVYMGFCFLAASLSYDLQHVPQDRLLGAIASLVLGPIAGILTSIAVALACLTTAIALASVFAHYLHRDIFQNRVKYIPCLIFTLVVSFFISTLEFTGIVRLLTPFLTALYPSLIALSIVNIFHKLYGFKPVKTIILIIFLLTLLIE